MTSPSAFDYYAELQVDSSASLEQITSAYRRLARVHHPDRNHGNEEHATTSFQRLQQAYETLTDPVKRDRYDNPPSHAPRSSFYYEEGDDDDDDIFYEYEEFYKSDDFPFDVDDNEDDFFSNVFGPSSGTGYPGYSSFDAWEREMERRERLAAEMEARYRELARLAYAERIAREEQAKARQAAKRAAKQALLDAKLVEKDTHRGEEARLQQQRWREGSAVTKDERFASCLHSDYCRKIDLRKKVKCQCCLTKRGTMAFECPHCLVHLCQLCVTKFSARRQKLSKSRSKSKSKDITPNSSTTASDRRSMDSENDPHENPEEMPTKVAEQNFTIPMPGDKENTQPLSSPTENACLNSKTQPQKLTNNQKRERKKLAKVKNFAFDDHQQTGLPTSPPEVETDPGLDDDKTFAPGDNKEDLHPNAKGTGTTSSLPFTNPSVPSAAKGRAVNNNTAIPPPKADKRPGGKISEKHKAQGNNKKNNKKKKSKPGKEAGADTNNPTAAFVRALGPNQAVTVELLRAAMEAFGAVVTVEMKKRKDLATVIFGNAESLHKAIAASPVILNPQLAVKVVKQHIKEATG